MTTVKIYNREGSEFEKGVNALINLVDNRIYIDKIFVSTDVLKYLIRSSGGSVRDLMRLLNYAQLSARVDKKEKIDKDSADQGINKVEARV